MKRVRQFLRSVAMYMALHMFLQVLLPSAAWALGGGPSQPETQSFTPVGTSEMVDMFTGDFTYNIPLMDVGGYPVNLGYSAGITPDQEASWVGLGWNINPGSISRNMRSLPDDFDGDLVTKEFNMKDNHTFGVKANANVELFGIQALNAGIGSTISYNNYTGFGFDFSPSLGVSAGLGSKTKLNASLGLTLSSETGATVAPSVSVSRRAGMYSNASQNFGGRIGLSYNSRDGLKQVSFGYDYGITAGRTASTGASATLFSSYPTFVPKIDFPMTNVNANVGVNFGGDAFGLAGMAGLGAFYSGQYLATKSLTLPAFGYANTQNANYNEYAMLDYNREKDGSFTQNTPNLPITNYTYDVYSLSGQGIGGTFRPFRNDLNSVYDTKSQSVGGGGSLDNLEFGAAVSLHIGGNVSFNSSRSESGKWDDAVRGVSGIGTEAVNNLYEHTHFRMAGEKTVDPDFSRLANIGGFGPSKPLETSNEPSSAISSTSFEGVANIQKTRSVNNGRMVRNEHIKVVKAGERDKKAFTKVVSYVHGDFKNYASNPVNRTIPNHHYGEFAVTKADGSRYMYGIPVYNNSQDEITYATNKTDPNGTGLCDYESSQDGTSNTSGTDNFYNKSSLPPYATSYLLTAVLSHDYVDSDGIPGPSEKDLGNYTKLNYTRAQGAFKWRNPSEVGKAQFNEGLYASELDNKANLLYGEKEIWYLHSIETKTYVADFYTSPRRDGLGVKDKDGTLDPGTSLFRLDSIALYAKAEKVANPSAPLPIKKVHFIYSYELAKNTPNSLEGGKLTLKSLYFTYGRSQKGVLNPYMFRYGQNADENPDYGQKLADRWGYYKKTTNAAYKNDVFPYSEQDPTQANKNAAVWSLKELDTPHGATIKVNYEADDYAYVQNKKAMEMFIVSNDSKDLYSNGAPSFQLKIALKPEDKGKITTADFINRYLGDMPNLYFKFLVNLKPGRQEYVQGYADIDRANCSVNNDYGYVAVQYTGGVSPIAKAGFQFTRMHLPKLIQSSDVTGSRDVLGMAKAVLAAFGSVAELFDDQDAFCKKNNVAKTFEKGWIRLVNPDGHKRSGGHRVKSVMIYDNWDKMYTGNSSFYYGQEYDYTTVDASGRKISSGVAAYEPINGNEENPFRQPVFYDKEKLLAPSEEFYAEEPFGESFFPSPTIGYSKVTVRNLARPGVKRSATGYTVHEFYTAKDYPTITLRTEISPDRFRPSPIISLLKLESQDYVTARQGFYVEVNDMHGKPKAQNVYAEGGVAPISGMQYFYKEELKTTSYNNGGNISTIQISGLANNMPTVDATGNVTNTTLGVDYDIVHDAREYKSTTSMGGANGNTETITIPPFLVLIVPVILPTANKDDTRFRSSVITKVVQRYGIQTKTVAFEDGASVYTNNLAWDAQTGDVLLTEVTNQFSDKVYNFTYPAHWVYPGMGQAYKNDGYSFSNIDRLIEGDVVLSGNNTYWYAGQNKFLDKDGNTQPVTSGVVLRSGRRNMPDVPVGSITLLSNPIQNGKIDFNNLNAGNRVLNASATEMGSNFKVHCECGFDPSKTYNPYLRGLAGIHRPYKTYMFLTERVQTRKNNNTFIRTDGTYKSFSPFWVTGANSFLKANPTAWQFTSQTTEYNPLGFELENLDPLGRYSTALFGYNYTLPVATSDNSMYHESAFDGFEDYDYSGCANEHLRFGDFKDKIKRDQAHTGRYSIRLLPGDEIKLEKIIDPCQNTVTVPEIPVVK